MIKLTNISRRSFLAGSTALGVAGWLGMTATRALSQAQSITLEVREVNGKPTYNGVTPGQTMYADPGETIDVHLINSLPRLDDDCGDDFNNFHGLNTTNLHTHGLHVSPTTDSTGEFDADNVFLSVTPKDQFVPCEDVCGSSVEKAFRNGETHYRFELKPDHPSGTFWYHAHKHGATQAQVAAGLVGPIIVRDRPGVMPSYIEDADELIFVIMNDGIVLADPNGGGELNPKIMLRPGQVQRWRIINAQSSGQGGGSFARLSTNVPALEMYQIAFDGITLSRRIRIDQSDGDEPWLNAAAMAPGNRMDLMVHVPADAKAQNFAMDMAANISELFDLTSNTQRIGMEIEISDNPVDHNWSDDPALPGAGFTEFSDEQLLQRRITFQGGFAIDREQFTGEVKHTMTLGTQEEWVIENATSAVHAHHIHVNPFLVTHINGVKLASDDPRRRWQDTVALPFSSNDGPGTITYKTRFETFKGKFVIHCHVLRHEDRGMMQTVEVV